LVIIPVSVMPIILSVLSESFNC